MNLPSQAPLGKIVDDVFDEQCSGRSAESAMSASSIYSSNRYIHIISQITNSSPQLKPLKTSNYLTV